MALDGLLAAFMGYLLGAFPTGYLVGRLWKGIDVREYGSGRTGGANVLRSLGLVAATITVIGDVGKGAVAVLAARAIWHNEAMVVAAGLAALVGHIWPIFLSWRGGAGVATCVGALLALEPLALLMAAIVACPTAILSRYVSLGSLTLASLVPLLIMGRVLLTGGTLEHIAYGFLAAALIIFSHRPNIARILKGTERRIGEPGRKR